MVGLLVNVNLNDFSSPPPPPLSVPSAFVLGGPDVSLYTIFSIIFGEVSLVLCNVVKEFNGIEIALSSSCSSIGFHSNISGAKSSLIYTIPPILSTEHAPLIISMVK